MRLLHIQKVAEAWERTRLWSLKLQAKRTIVLEDHKDQPAATWCITELGGKRRTSAKLGDILELAKNKMILPPCKIWNACTSRGQTPTRGVKAQTEVAPGFSVCWKWFHVVRYLPITYRQRNNMCVPVWVRIVPPRSTQGSKRRERIRRTRKDVVEEGGCTLAGAVWGRFRSYLHLSPESRVTRLGQQPTTTSLPPLPSYTRLYITIWSPTSKRRLYYHRGIYRRGECRGWGVWTLWHMRCRFL